ncbi:hypothetical protein [Neobacillus sp. LXY-4]|uniref:hypothetical protein n=1 Tax=Neobacillus sp. LXY-4 TaxID=3379826 RepID=UPI003EE3683E
MEIPLSQIKEIRTYAGPEKISRQEAKNIFDARPVDFFMEKPMFEIDLKEPLRVELMYGFKRTVDRVLLNIDEPNEFFSAIQNAIIQANTECQ